MQGVLHLPNVLLAKLPWKKVLGAAAAAAVATGGIGYGVSKTDGLGGGGGGSGTANIWVDSDGGTCVDNASLVSYDTATACGSLQAANATCDNGDVVLIKVGTNYPGESITGTGNGRTSMCTISAESGKAIFTSDVLIGSQPINGVPQNGPDWLTINNIQCGTSTTSATNEAELYIYDNSNNIVIDGWDCASFDLFHALNVTIKNGDWGPCGSSSSRKCLTRFAVNGAPANLLIENNKIHDIYCGNGSPSACDLYHTDGLAIFGGDGITVRGNKFYRNDVINIRIQECCTNDPIKNLTIENNWFGPTCNGSTSAWTPCTVGTSGQGIDVDSPIDGLKVRFNSFTTGGGIVLRVGTDFGTAASPAEFVGNSLTVGNGCGNFANYRYNASRPFSAFSGQTPCGATDVLVPIATGFGYTTEDVNSIDYHIGSGSALNNIVPTTVTGGCPATDIDGTARPINTNCDAGSDER